METYGATLQFWLLIGSLLAAGAALACARLYSVRCERKSAPAAARASPSPPLPPGHGFGLLCIIETFLLLRALRHGSVGSFLRARSVSLGSKTFRTRLFFHPAAIVQGAAANRFIAHAEQKQQLFNSFPASFLEALGEHIPSAMHGAPHRRLRQIIASCVGPLALRKLVAKADLLTRLHFENSWHAPCQISLFSLVKQHAFHVACSLLAGTEDEALLARLHQQFTVWTAGIFALPLDLPGTTFRKAKNARKVLVHELNKLLDRRQEEIAANGAQLGNEDNMLGMLLTAKDEKGSFLNRKELQDVVLFLLFAGHDTAAATLAFALKFLELNPACYDRLCQEHRAIVSHKNPKETLNWSDIENMKYTWAVVQETLRLRPIGVGGVKEVREDVIFDGYKIPKGWKVCFNMSATHEDETFFHEASKFDPSRFEFNGLQDGYRPPPYVYIPFGIGPHSCPGSEFAKMLISIYLHHLALRQYKWKSCDPNEKLRCCPVLQPARNYVAKVYIEE